MSEETKIKELLERGVEEVIDKEHLEERLKKGDNLRVKLGIDPTSPNIHLGRAIALRKLRAFQDLGHTAVLIIGDFTALIGDTSDKDAERPMMTKKQVKENMRTYFDQAFKILNKKNTETHYNSKWLGKLGGHEIGEMADLYGLHDFESREVVSRRLKAGKRVSVRELLYPLFQGYDSVAVRADLELGGTDQRFNLLAGRIIQKHYGQTAQDIMTTTLLEGTDGRKMSSSWGNVINLTDSADDMFGKVMSLPDELMDKYFLLLTDVPLEEIKNLKNDILHQTTASRGLKEWKQKLASAIVASYHGKEKAVQAEEEFRNVFAAGGVPENIPVIKIGSDKIKIIDLLVGNNICQSKSEAKRLVEQGGVKINEQVIREWKSEVSFTKGAVLRVGPMRFYRLE